MMPMAMSTTMRNLSIMDFKGDEMKDICRNYHCGQDTSEEAFDSIRERIPTLKTLIYDYIERVGNASCEQIEAIFRIKHQTASARLAELKSENLIYVATHKKNSSGRLARVYSALCM